MANAVYMLHRLMTSIDARARMRSTQQEDEPVLRFLRSLPQDKEYSYLEAGSGLGRFASLLYASWKNSSIDCLEINPQLVEMTARQGLRSTVASLTSIPFQDQHFDVIHCSHVVEHFAYPGITTVLDEPMRVLKPNVYFIIRTPLAHPKFYTDIDHVRPYPPESILHYFRNAQQQKISPYKISEIYRWYRRVWLGIYCFPDVKLVFYMNFLLKAMWAYLKFPISKPNGYVLILKKLPFNV